MLIFDCTPVRSAQLKNDQDALERRLASQRKELIELHKEAVAKARFRCVLTPL